MGPEGVKACLRAGANDLGGTLMDETITRSAGAVHGQEMTPARMESIIRSLGRVPRQRTTLYGTAPEERCRASFARRCQALQSHPTGGHDDEPRSVTPTSWITKRRRSAVERAAQRPRRRCRPGGSWPSPIAHAFAATVPHPTRSIPTRRTRRTCGACTGSTTPIANARVAVPGHVVLPSELTGVDAPIVVLLGRRFPMIGAHKVLAAYACLVPRLVTGRFDPASDRAVWPSTGNYCRGGVAISRILGCRGVAVLPAGMSRERFDWLEQLGRRSGRHRPHAGHGEQRQGNLRQVRRAVAAIRENVILNQFSEFANYLIHYYCTGPRLRSRVLAPEVHEPRVPAGGIRLGDRLGRHDRRRRLPESTPRLEDRRGRGARVPDHAVQRLRRAQHPGHRRQAHPADPQRHEHRCRRRRLGPQRPTRSTSCSAATSAAPISDRRRTIDPDLVRQFDDIGISGLANIVAAIKVAKHLDYGPDDVVMTVATDSAALYGSERRAFAARRYPRRLRRGERRRDLRPPPGGHRRTTTCSS